ncbi:MAG TPA: hypothetical protein VIV60_27030, partial [Polyangiaceae bacterium]
MRRILCLGAFSTLVTLGCSQTGDGALASPSGGTENSSNATSASTTAGGQTGSVTTAKGGSGQSGSSNSAAQGSNSNASGSTADGSTAVGGSGATSTSSSTGGSSVTEGTATGGSRATSSTSRGGSSSSGGSKSSGGGASGNRGGSSSSAGGKSSAGGTSSAAGGSSSAELTKSQCDGKPGPSYADFFDNSKLATLRITVDSAAMGGGSTSAWLDYFWSKWSHCSPYTYIKTQFAYEAPDSTGNVTCQNVGMRIRGSRPKGTNEIQGFKLDMQVLDTAATTHRRFADENRLNILSVEADPS